MKKLTKKDWEKIMIEYFNDGLNHTAEMSIEQCTLDTLRAIMIMMYLERLK